MLRRSEFLLISVIEPDGQPVGLAKMTVYTAKGEWIISMESFREMLETVRCDDRTVVLFFKSNASFQYAVHAWKWVNEDAENSFIMVVNHHGCGDGTYGTQPYNISGIRYDEQHFATYLLAEKLSWREAVHTFDLDFTNNFGYGIGARQLATYDKSTTLSLTNDFSQDLFSEDIGEVTISVACTDCTTEGGMVVSVHVGVSIGNLEEFTISASPKDFIATMELQASIEATLGSPYSWRQKITSVELGGFTIADILTLDSTLDYYIGFSVSAWQSFSAVTFGTSATLSDSAVAEIDLLNIKHSNFSGWAPTFQPLPISASTRVSGDMVAYSEPALTLHLTVLGIGFEAGLDFKLPEARIHLEGFASDKEVGINVETTLDVTLVAQVGFAGVDLVEDPIYNNSWPPTKDTIGITPDSNSVTDVSGFPRKGVTCPNKGGEKVIIPRNGRGGLRVPVLNSIGRMAVTLEKETESKFGSSLWEPEKSNGMTCPRFQDRIG
ncbi:hypothetical protein FGG08_002248 [Glutinoglossum americanum]|uniref:Uncharacterized protein n=1 Tax=Glutinoglossum americanum TaxID=1670608 RepID=A0A9P8I9L4_9PEZI|nr:hypothetical protein FGG08_002248 [Glutinoglossum americanum]